MSYGNVPNAFSAAVEEFRQHANRPDAEQVVAGLAGGLTLLRESLFRRIHQDVERTLGKDSLLMPVSEAEAVRKVGQETELYQVAESVANAIQRGYIQDSDGWYLNWLARLRLGERATDAAVRSRLLHYWSAATDDRRLAFLDALDRVLPESRQAPLVLFRLYPLAIRVVTALVFDDRAGAENLRREQVETLPPIIDCRQCRGAVLELGKECETCGNPLWKHEYLVLT